MATTEDRLGRVPGLSEQVNERLASLDTGLREGLREIRHELRGMNTRLDGKASMGWVLGFGVWLSVLMTFLSWLTRR